MLQLSADGRWRRLAEWQSVSKPGRGASRRRGQRVTAMRTSPLRLRLRGNDDRGRWAREHGRGSLSTVGADGSKLASRGSAQGTRLLDGRPEARCPVVGFLSPMWVLLPRVRISRAFPPLLQFLRVPRPFPARRCSRAFLLGSRQYSRAFLSVSGADGRAKANHRFPYGVPRQAGLAHDAHDAGRFSKSVSRHRQRHRRHQRR
jgi:hypothetical protein